MRKTNGKAKGAGRVSRCRMCHREMTNPAHIAAGIGPECAKKSARGGGRSAAALAKVAYPAAKLARIERNVERCAKAIERAQEYRAAAFHIGTPAQRERGEWLVWLTMRWLNRWRAIQRQVTVAA